jgi:hypothetical protein
MFGFTISAPMFACQTAEPIVKCEGSKLEIAGGKVCTYVYLFC